MSANEFGNHLRALRKSKSLTTRQVADLSGVSQSFISNLENGNRGIPSPEILQKLAAALEVPYLEMMEKAGYLPNFLEEELAKSLYETRVLSKSDHDKTLSNNQLEQLDYVIPQSKRGKGQGEKSIELVAILNNPNITYRGQSLSEEDRQSILDMLKLMFRSR